MRPWLRMPPMSTNKLVISRLIDDWKLLLSIFIGIMVATSLVAGAPIYIRTLERLGMNTAIDRASQPFLDIYAIAPHVPLSRSGLEESDNVINDATRSRIAEIYNDSERYLKAPNYLVGTPKQPLNPQEMVFRGYFQNLSNLADHVTFLNGRMATDEVREGSDGLVVEAVISEIGRTLFSLEVGDIVVLAPNLIVPTRVSALIVGILEPTDREEGYWQQDADLFIAPQPLSPFDLPDLGILFDPGHPPLPLFITYEALIEGVGKSYPGSLVSASWYITVDKENLKLWSTDEMRTRLDQLEADVADVLRGSEVFSGIGQLLNRFERRSFFTSVPLLLLLVIMVVTVLYYTFMMVSYLVRSRDADVVLLRSRGVSTWQLAKLYAIEGIILTTVASVLAPFVAMGAISVSGKLGYFEDITLGATLPVAFHWMPFAIAAGTGLLCLMIFVLPAVVAARSGLVGHKLRSSRPPATPFFQRYNVDIALLIMGGLIFWELYSRGQIVSGRLFDDVVVNEVLLFAPVLLLTAVALLFMRFFPLLVRYISGDSPTLMHVVAAATFVTLATTISARELRAVSGPGWPWDLALLCGFGVVYIWTQRARLTWNRAAGLIVQAGLVALLIFGGMPSRDDASFIPTIVVALLVPFQLLFLLMRGLARVYPVWVSLAIWHMARNPLPHSWLVLLLVMVTGLAVLATTVGGTLDRSYEERILYEVGADLRVTAVPSYFFARSMDDLKDAYLEIPGVTAISLALRGTGSIGTSYGGSVFSMLALESKDFPNITWYRGDFSHTPLTGVMRSLRAGSPIKIPESATSLRVWVQPRAEYPNLSLRMVVQDRNGVLDTLSLGSVGRPEWHQMETAIPTNLEPPVNLVSVQIYEPDAGSAGTAGSISFDDIEAVFENGEAAYILDDFEDFNGWTTPATSSDVLRATGVAPFNGQRSGVFSFGRNTDSGIRGFYRSLIGDTVPVVTSSSFVRASATRIGDEIIVTVLNRTIPIKIVDTVEFFPTMDPSGAGFLLVDLDNMLRHLNMLRPTAIVRPNELFVDEAPGDEEAVYRTATSLAGPRATVHDRAALLESVRLDPLITAGWKAMVILAAGISLFAASMGYITYLLSFAGENRREMGFLRALGLTTRQMGWLLSAEHLVVVAFGLIIGTATGFAMSNILLSGIAVTETGNPVLPPFVLTTRWSLMAGIYLGMLLMFASALYWLSRRLIRVDLHEIS